MKAKKQKAGNYIDGYVLPLPKKSLAVYRRMARLGAKIWMDHGALDYHECVGEDLAASFGVPFPKALKVKQNETVIFAWIVFESRAHRDRVNAKVMKDPRLASMDPKTMPFDCNRMIYGGFKVLVRG